MLVSRGADTSVQAKETWPGGSDARLQTEHAARTTGPVTQGRTRRGVLVRCGILAALVLAYRLSLSPLHGLVGSPAFLLGLGICLLAAVWLGVRGALVVIVCVAFIDRAQALQLPHSPETGRTAGIIAPLVKLVLAGGLGMVLDSRRRALALNAELRREIEARKQSEASLQRSEALQRALVESLGEGVGLFDSQERAVFANGALAGTLGVARDELSTKPFSEFLTEESRRTLALTTPNLGERRSYEVVLEQNASRLLLVTETRFEPSGSHDQLTLRVVRDFTDRVVTERRQRDLERELQRSQALQSLAVMAGGVAHDFNNLLCGVVGNAEIALRKVSSDSSPMVPHCLSEILVFAGEAAQLSKQMLAYAGQRSLAIQALELNAELNAALRLLHATIESKAQLVLELGDELPPVGADRFQLRQVVTNLILNALDAMEGTRGTLTLRSESVQLVAPSNEPYGVERGRLRESDSQRYRRRHSPRGTRAVVRAVLFDQRGRAGDGPGRRCRHRAGARRLARCRPDVDASRPASSSCCRSRTSLWLVQLSVPLRRSRAAARTILLIDDEPAVRLVTGRMLSELGHQVLTADSGARGLQLLKEQPEAVDLVILDLTMPEQSGEQTLEQLRLLRSKLPVAITSGFHAEDASMLLKQPYVIGFLEKPHTMTSLEMLLASITR